MLYYLIYVSLLSFGQIPTVSYAQQFDYWKWEDSLVRNIDADSSCLQAFINLDNSIFLCCIEGKDVQVTTRNFNIFKDSVCFIVYAGGNSHFFGKKRLNSNIGVYTNAKYIDFDCGSSKILLPEEIGKLEHLKKLFIKAHLVKKSIPETIGTLSELVSLYIISTNQLFIRDQVFSHLNNLKFLHIEGKKINKVPATISHLRDLEILRISAKSVKSFEWDSSGFNKLRSLWLDLGSDFNMPSGFMHLKINHAHLNVDLKRSMNVVSTWNQLDSLSIDMLNRGSLDEGTVAKLKLLPIQKLTFYHCTPALKRYLEIQFLERRKMVIDFQNSITK